MSTPFDRFEWVRDLLLFSGLPDVARKVTSREVKGTLFALSDHELSDFCAKLQGESLTAELPLEVGRRHAITAQIQLWVDDGQWYSGDAFCEYLRRREEEQCAYEEAYAAKAGAE